MFVDFADWCVQSEAVPDSINQFNYRLQVQLALVGLNVLMLGFDVTKGVAANRVSEPAREKQE